MRFLTLILSLTLLFQPASWAAGGVTAGEHVAHCLQQSHPCIYGQIKSNTAQGAHCQKNAAQAASQHHADSNPQLHHHSKLGCFTAGAYAPALARATTLFPARLTIEFVTHAPTVSFQSRNDPPEVQPPLFS